MCTDSCNIGITAVNHKSSVLDFFDRSFLEIDVKKLFFRFEYLSFSFFFVDMDLCVV